MAEYDMTFDKPFVGFDNSKSSHILLDIFKQMHAKFQKSVIVHVSDPIKNYIPSLMKGPAIEKQLNDQLSQLKQIDIKLVNKSKDSGKSTNEILLTELYQSKSSFMMIGFVGSKGRKPRPEQLSSRIRRFVYDSKIPVAVIKKPLNPNINMAAFCFDGSQISFEGLKKGVSFCRKFGYLLTVIHMYTQVTKNYSKQVRNALKEMQGDYKDLKMEVVVEEGNLGNYLKEKGDNYDWIIMNRNGYRGQISNSVFVGSKTTQILTGIDSNMIILN